MRASEGGGYGSGTIVVNAEDLRGAAAVSLDTAEALHELAARIGNRSVPELPPEIAGIVPGALLQAAGMLDSAPADLFNTAQELRARAFWADVADRLARGEDLSDEQIKEFKAGMASGVLPKYANSF